jgi:HK97 family phage portal protein
MDNIFKRMYKAAVNKSAIGLRSITNTNSFQVLNGFFSFGKGKYDMKEYLDAYGNHPLVYMVINRISTTSAAIKRVAVDDNGEPLDNSTILDLLNDPNPNQNRIEFYEAINENHEATGNAFIWHIQGIGAGNELKVLPSDKVEIITNTNDTEVLRYDYCTPGGTTIKIPKEEVLHIHTNNMVNTDGCEAYYGLSRLQAAWIVVKSSREKYEAEASITKNRGAAGMVTSDTDTPLSPKERERMQTEFDEDHQGAHNFGSVKVSTTKLRYLQFGMSPTDLKILEGKLSDLRDITAIYGLSSVLFNDTANSTYNNVREAEKASYTNVFIPLGNKVDDKLSRFLSERLGVDEKVIIDLTSIEVIKATTNEVAQALDSLSPLLANRITESMTEDELRAVVGLDELGENETPIGRAGTDATVNVEG